MARLERVAALFPFHTRIRFLPAVFCSEKRWKGSGARCIAAIRRELAFDPFDYGLRRNLAGLLIEAGRQEEAAQELLFIVRMAPHLKIMVPVNVNPDTL